MLVIPTLNNKVYKLFLAIPPELYWPFLQGARSGKPGTVLAMKISAYVFLVSNYLAINRYRYVGQDGGSTNTCGRKMLQGVRCGPGRGTASHIPLETGFASVNSRVANAENVAQTT